MELIVPLLIVYFLPGYVASVRRHHNSVAILALNVLLGWTLLGWAVAFVWACTYVIPDRARTRSSWPTSVVTTSLVAVGLFWAVVVGSQIALRPSNTSAFHTTVSTR